jgi:hypothetical protein
VKELHIQIHRWDLRLQFIAVKRQLGLGKDAVTKHIVQVETRVDGMGRNLSALLAKNEEGAIHFAGLGFQTMAECNAWLEIAMRMHQSGLIVDIHMVFEYV